MLAVILCFGFTKIKMKHTSIPFGPDKIDSFIQDIEKYTNEQYEDKLNKITNNDVSTQQLLSDFSKNKLKVVDKSYYKITDSILRVELICDYDNESKTYLIMIDNKKTKWEVYVTGFI
ncbi:MAG: hypothetical protein KH415_21020 [Clostridium sp.]|nr:hypothetical protein [Clostridium sp.]